VLIVTVLVIGAVALRSSYVPPKWVTNINDALMFGQGVCATNQARLLTSFDWSNRTELLFRPFNDSTVVVYVHDGVIRNLGIVEVCIHLVQGNHTANYYLSNKGERISLSDMNATIKVSIYLP